MINQVPIFVTGVPRSGTTMIARVINCCGAFAGDGATSKKCMFQNKYIDQLIVKPYMERMGADPNGQFPLPNIDEISIPLNWRQKVENIIRAEHYVNGPWMYKDTKMPLIWKVWHNAFPKAKWIIVRRRTGDVIQSCLKTNYMNAYEDEKGWIEWIHAYEKRFEEMMEAGIDLKVIWPERMCNNDFQQLYDIIEWTGLEWKEEASVFVKLLLWKSNQNKIEKEAI
jgi:hypothetical protein